MHMPRWEQLRSFLTWKTKWWRACKCLLQLHEHKGGTYKKSLSSSLQNPFRPQLSQREHQFSVWRATTKPASESHSPSWDRLSSSTISVLSAKTEGTVLCQAGVCAHLLCRVWGTYLQDVSLQYSEEGNSQLLSLRNNECKRFRLKKTTHTENVSYFFPQSHTVPALSWFWEPELQYGNTSLHSTAMAAQTLRTEEEVSGLNPAHALLVVTRISATSHCWRSHWSSLPLLQGYAKEKMTM